MSVNAKLRHFSVLPVFEVRDADQRPFNADHYYEKPRGLWVSDETDPENNISWQKWAGEDAPSLLSPLEHAVELAAGANIKHIATIGELDEFAERYGERGNRRYCEDEWAINWPLVATHFDGILITPYLWERRLHTGSSWYYGWDCASGCIWKSRAVAKIEIVHSLSEAASKLEAYAEALPA